MSFRDITVIIPEDEFIDEVQYNFEIPVNYSTTTRMFEVKLNKLVNQKGYKVKTMAYKHDGEVIGLSYDKLINSISPEDELIATVEPLFSDSGLRDISAMFGNNTIGNYKIPVIDTTTVQEIKEELNKRIKGYKVLFIAYKNPQGELIGLVDSLNVSDVPFQYEIIAIVERIDSGPNNLYNAMMSPRGSRNEKRALASLAANKRLRNTKAAYKGGRQRRRGTRKLRVKKVSKSRKYRNRK